MTLKLFYDTETSGLPDYKAPSEAAHQPFIIQLAALLVNAAGREVAALNVLIKPMPEFKLDAKITDLTGITQTQLDEQGLEPEVGMRLFWEMACAAKEFIGHNENFDGRMVRIMLKKLARHEKAEMWEKRKKYCTMEGSKNICKLPPTERMIAAGFNSFKAPKLQEAYRHFFGKDFDGAHDALNDVRATLAVYNMLQPSSNSNPSPVASC